MPTAYLLLAFFSSLSFLTNSRADDPKENPDTIGIEGAMRFLEAIQVRLDEVACLGIAELLKSPSMGEFTRAGFVDGWKSAGFVYSRMPWLNDLTDKRKIKESSQYPR